MYRKYSNLKSSVSNNDIHFCVGNESRGNVLKPHTFYTPRPFIAGNSCHDVPYAIIESSPYRSLWNASRTCKNQLPLVLCYTLPGNCFGEKPMKRSLSTLWTGPFLVKHNHHAINYRQTTISSGWDYCSIRTVLHLSSFFSVCFAGMCQGSVQSPRVSSNSKFPLSHTVISRVPYCSILGYIMCIYMDVLWILLRCRWHFRPMEEWALSKVNYLALIRRI